MANVSEPLKSAVNFNELKRLISSNQNGEQLGVIVSHSVTRRQYAAGALAEPNPFISLRRNVVSLMISLYESKEKASCKVSRRVSRYGRSEKAKAML